MSAREFFTKGWPTQLGFFLGKHLPSRAGDFIAQAVTRVLVTLKPEIYHSVYDNQRHVLGLETPAEKIKANTRQVFFNSARSYYEFFHNVGQGRVRVEDFEPPVNIVPQARAYIQQALDSGRGLLILGAHLSNFNLSGIALGQIMSVPLQVLSLADPSPGFVLFNKLRVRAGALLTPISTDALRQALRRLQRGGAVITGVERPIGEGDQPVEFFGERAYLPANYIRIPLRTNSLVITMATYFEEGEYRMVANPPLELIRTGSRGQNIAVNQRRILAEFEDFIRRAPEQWFVFDPVWR